MKQQVRVLGLFLLITWSFFGCASQKNLPKHQPPAAFSARLAVEADKRQFVCRCVLENPQNCTITFEAPKAIEGLCIQQTPAECILRFKGLQVTTPSTYLAQTAFLKRWFSVCAALQDCNAYTVESGETHDYYIGKTPDGTAFTCTWNRDTNALSHVSIPHEALQIEVTEFQRLPTS